MCVMGERGGGGCKLSRELVCHVITLIRLSVILLHSLGLGLVCVSICVCMCV